MSDLILSIMWIVCSLVVAVASIITKNSDCLWVIIIPAIITIIDLKKYLMNSLKQHGKTHLLNQL